MALYGTVVGVTAGYVQDAVSPMLNCIQIASAFAHCHYAGNGAYLIAIERQLSPFECQHQHLDVVGLKLLE